MALLKFNFHTTAQAMLRIGYLSVQGSDKVKYKHFLRDSKTDFVLFRDSSVRNTLRIISRRHFAVLVRFIWSDFM